MLNIQNFRRFAAFPLKPHCFEGNLVTNSSQIVFKKLENIVVTMNCVKNVSPVFIFQDKFVPDLISGETWRDISLGGPRTITCWGDLNLWGDLRPPFIPWLAR